MHMSKGTHSFPPYTHTLGSIWGSQTLQHVHKGSWIKPPTPMINGRPALPPELYVYICIHKWISCGQCRSLCCLFDQFCPIRESSRHKATNLKFNPYSTQMHFIDLTVTKNSVARAIMLAITQLYSLCMYYFQDLNFNQAKQEGRGAGLVDRVRVNLLNKWQRGCALGCWWRSLLHK